MRKTDFISKVAEATGFTKKDTTAVIDATYAAIKEVLMTEGEFSVPGIGKLVIGEVGEKKCMNLQTGEPMVVPAHKTCKFRIATALKTELK